MNFNYEKMTKKMYGNLQEKYKNSVFQILNMCNAFSNFDFNSTIRKKIQWLVQLFGNNVTSYKRFR